MYLKKEAYEFLKSMDNDSMLESNASCNLFRFNSAVVLPIQRSMFVGSIVIAFSNSSNASSSFPCIPSNVPKFFNQKKKPILNFQSALPDAVEKPAFLRLDRKIAGTHLPPEKIGDAQQCRPQLALHLRAIKPESGLR